MVFARLEDLRVRQGNPAAAIGAYRTALELNPDDKELRKKLLPLTR